MLLRAGDRIHSKETILDPEADEFLRALQRHFGASRQELMEIRARRQEAFDTVPSFGLDPRPDAPYRTEPPATPQTGLGQMMLSGPPEPDFLASNGNGPANVLVADFDNCLSPTWVNCLEGHACVLNWAMTSSASVKGAPARRWPIVSVRPRNWGVEESHFLVDGSPMSASLFDFGLNIFQLARAQSNRSLSALFSIGKLDGCEEAALWARAFRYAEQHLGIPPGAIQVIVTIDTVSSVVDRDQILAEFEDYAVALECSPVNYLSSFIRSFSSHGRYLLPQRSDLTARQPFLQVYRELMIHTCRQHHLIAISSYSQGHRAGSGGEMCKSEMTRVESELKQELELGFDTICVTDPDLIPAALAAFHEPDNRRLRTRRSVEPCHISLDELLLPCYGKITVPALRENVELTLETLERWLAGCGSATMAEAELRCAQLWQWIRHSAPLSGGRRMTPYLLECLVRDTVARIEGSLATSSASQFHLAAELLLQSCTDRSYASLADRASVYLN
ncbi:MAG: hypothetical protein WA510_22905 [Acidobacteriaceae bacterium]